MLISAMMAGPTHAQSSKHVMFILDASNSMWGQIDGTPKIMLAKSVLKEQFGRLPAGTKAGLIAYGHRFARELNDCQDMELVGGYDEYSSATISSMLDTVTPKGQTPIANTLRESIAWVARDRDGQSVASPTVVLITDGVESCGGDPCAAARDLANAGIDTKVHVVGFDLTAKQRGEVECIAANGGGKYFDAGNGAGLSDALRQVEIEIAQVEPAPAPESAPTVYFEDEFDVEDLADQWEVVNPNPDRYLIEEGKLLLVSGPNKSGFAVPETPNLLTIDAGAPKGNFEFSALVSADYATVNESFWIGMYENEQNYVAVRLYTYRSDGWKLFLRVEKNSGGEVTYFGNELASMHCRANTCGEGKTFPDFAKMIAAPIRISLVRKGRKAFARAEMTGADGKPLVLVTDSLSALRLPGKPTIAAGQEENVRGETLFYVDEVEITEVE
jgi:hypothetical protein